MKCSTRTAHACRATRKEAAWRTRATTAPRLERPLITALYHAAKAQRIPMTQLASSLVREGLERIAEPAESETASVREEPQTPPQPDEK